MKNKKELLRLKRHRRICLKMRGTKEKPRLVVHRSLKNMHAQVIDDIGKTTLVSMSTQDKQIKDKFPYRGNVKAAEFFGVEFAKKVKEKNITSVIFDRAGYLYHGRIKVFAESLRKGGLVF